MSTLVARFPVIIRNSKRWKLSTQPTADLRQVHGTQCSIVESPDTPRVKITRGKIKQSSRIVEFAGFKLTINKPCIVQLYGDALEEFMLFDFQGRLLSLNCSTENLTAKSQSRSQQPSQALLAMTNARDRNYSVRNGKRKQLSNSPAVSRKRSSTE